MTFTNPLLDLNLPDAHAFWFDGEFNILSGHSLDKISRKNMQWLSTRDFVTWKYRDGLPVLPAEAKTNHVWAPAAAVHPETGDLFFFISIGLSKAHDYSGIWIARYHPELGYAVADDKPLVYDRGFSEIDPMVHIHPVTGEPVLLWGSAGSGIRSRTLNDSWTGFAENSKTTVLIEANDTFPRERLAEGADAFFSRDTEYPITAYASGDDVWHPSYEVFCYVGHSLHEKLIPLSQAVGRKTKDNRVLVRGHDPNQYNSRCGHSTFFVDGAGQLWFSYHAVRETDPWQDRAAIDPGDLEDHELIKRVPMLQKVNNIDGFLIPEGGSLHQPAVPITIPQPYPVLPVSR